MPRPTRTGAFRLKGKKFLLTYPQCDFAKEEVLEHLKERFSPVYLRVCHELHENGDPHLHVFIAFASTKDYSSPRAFDLQLHDGKHGNYQVARTVAAAIQYVSKNDDWVEWGTIPRERSRAKDSDEAFSNALAAPTRQEAEDILLAQAPRDAVIFSRSIQAFLDRRFQSFQDYVSPFSEFPHIPGACLEWVSGNLVVCWTHLHT